MRVLLWSTVLYLAGIAVVLFLRPALMFKPDGSWKEFSIQASEDTSPFPFWLFCMSWALVSFLVTRLLFSEGQVDLLDAARKAALLSTVTQSATLRLGRGQLEEDLLQPLPTAANAVKKRKEEPKPGYYKLSGGTTAAAAGKKGGVPKYIYIGPEEPSGGGDSDVEES